MSNIVPILQMLNLSLMATPADVLDAIRRLQQQVDVQTRRGNAMEENWNEERLRRARAENPDNWRATFSGDPTTLRVDTTVLTHGNLISLDGTGQSLFHFHPCCQDLRCECMTRRLPGGHCICHKNDE